MTEGLGKYILATETDTDNNVTVDLYFVRNLQPLFHQMHTDSDNSVN